VKGDSILARSGQAWKFKLSMLFVLLGGAGMAVSRAMPPSESIVGLVASLAGVAAGLLGGLVFPSLSIRCPRCRARWFWMAISSKRHDEWFLWLLDARACPACEATLRH
jgi:hypothetical protein